MSSLARPFEIASITENGMETSKQSFIYAAQARDLVNTDFEPHLSVARTRSPYNALGIRQFTSGTPVSHLGFWSCCACGQMASESLSPERCSCCNHARCHTCGTA
ncbi:hypothetical protein N7486_007852 [Penicillium sp. IBT 16267x]|nr:hypothetical protein N7486_007852 [Penicillium sp. IBT 16267x]